jgi:hypothetical protein
MIYADPWEIRDRGILNEIPRFHPYPQMLKEAQVALLVCGEEGLQLAIVSVGHPAEKKPPADLRPAGVYQDRW